MAEAVTLELSDDVVRQARESAHRTGRQIKDVLADWISRGAASDDTTRLVAGGSYPIYTPYGNEAATQGLLDALNAAEEAAHPGNQQTNYLCYSIRGVPGATHVRGATAKGVRLLVSLVLKRVAKPNQSSSSTDITNHIYLTDTGCPSAWNIIRPHERNP